MKISCENYMILFFVFSLFFRTSVFCISFFFLNLNLWFLMFLQYFVFFIFVEIRFVIDQNLIPILSRDLGVLEFIDMKLR